MKGNGESQGGQADIGDTTASSFQQVREHELGQIKRRRRIALSVADEDPDVKENLVGLSLSGGGLRSASFSLGFLQALDRCGVLRFVDYLSTVSGGGYAGAYLSSEALRQKSGGTKKTPQDSGSDQERLSITPAGSDQKPTERGLQFIRKGDYLNDWSRFANRFIMGLLLMWLVIFSGLVAFSSLTAWVFRSLDHQASRDWLSALGFKSDISLAFFPAFVLALLWVICWTFSYIRKQERARGRVARWILFATLLSTVTALAMLMMTGNIAVSEIIGQENSQLVDSAAGWLWILIVTGIVIALLPYLRPRRLFQSGTNPQNAAEKYIFWIATRALVIGIPFLFIACFARENISGWEQERDQRLVSTDFSRGEATKFLDRNHLESLPVNNLQGAADYAVVSALLQIKAVTDSSNVQISPIPASEPSPTTPGAYLWTGETQQSELVAGSLGSDDPLTTNIYETLTKEDRRDEAATIDTEYFTDPRQAALAERSLALPDHDLHFFERWFALFSLPLEWMLETDNKNPLVEYVRAREARRTAQRKLFFLHNIRLLNPNFHQHFDADRLQEVYPGIPKGFKRDDLFVGSKGRQESDDDAKFWEMVTLAQQRAAERIAALPPIPHLAKVRESLEEARKSIRDRDFEDNEKSRKLAAIDAFEAFVVQFASPEQAGDIDDLARLAWQDYPRLLLKDPEVAEVVTGRPEPEHPYFFLSMIDRELLFQDLMKQETREFLVALEQRQREILEINRSLLSTMYPGMLREPPLVYSYVVLLKDQEERWWWFQWSLILFLVSALLVDLNATSWHGYYANRIAEMWIEPVAGLGREIPLGQLETVDVGRPYHLVNGTLQLLGKTHGDEDHRTKHERFLFSQLYCGAERIGYVPSEKWQDSASVRFSDVIAVSGGAVSPAVGANPLITVLLVLSNVRLGQWYANPNYRPSGDIARFWWVNYAVTPLRVMVRMIQPAEDRPYVFVTDGGHHENLGVETLLRRRCKLIIATDAGMDGEFTFYDLSRLIRLARIKYGIEFVMADELESTVSLDALIPRQKDQLSHSHYLVFKIKYPEDGEEPKKTGFLVYCKSTMTGNEPQDLLRYRQRNPDFPHESTADQFYDQDRFESYRQLGEKIGLEICRNIHDLNDEDVKALNVDEFIESFLGVSGLSEAEQAAETRTPELAPEIREQLEKLKTEDDPFDREVAVKALAQSPTSDPRVIEPLFDVVNEKVATLSATAGYVLTDEFEALSLPVLMNLMERKRHETNAKKPDAGERCTAGRLLQAIFRHADAAVAREVKRQNIVSRLAKSARTDGSKLVRVAAIQALSQLEIDLRKRLSEEQLTEIEQTWQDLLSKKQSDEVQQAARDAWERSKHFAQRE